MKKLSFQIAFGGISCALCIIMMLSVGLFPILVYVFPMLSSLVIFAVNYECGIKTAAASYISVSLLSLILSPDKESALLFLFFFGCYPLLSGYIDRLKSALFRWIVKFAFFNAAMVASYFLLIKVFVAVEMNEFGKYTVPVLLVSANLLLVLYDRMLRAIEVVYVRKIRKKLFKRK